MPLPSSRLALPFGLTGWRIEAVRSGLYAFSVPAAAMLAAALIGILSRPAGRLASVWVADAILVGLMLRFPRLARPAGWLGGATGYLLADLLTGQHPDLAVALTLANLASVAAGMLILSRLDESDRRLRRPMSMLHLAGGSAAAAVASGLAGSLAHPLFFDSPWYHGLLTWSSSELLAFVTILPVVLTMRPIRWARSLSARRLRRRADRHHLAPLLTLAASIGLALLMAGPGAFALPLAALLWCGLTYTMTSTALLTAVYSFGALYAIATERLPMHVDLTNPYDVLPLRVTIALLALTPVTVAVVMANRNDLLAQLRHMADHDPLTDLLNRRAFGEGIRSRLAHGDPQRRGLAFLMIDIDHFKQINDRIGHAGGDDVLQRFGQVVRDELRSGELAARMGGEEFAILLPDCGPADATRTIERLRRRFAGAIAERGFHGPDGTPEVITFSAGIAVQAHGSPAVEALHRDADAALYRAKREGRNRTVTVRVPS